MFEETLKVVAGLEGLLPIEILPQELDALFIKLATGSSDRNAYAIEDEIWDIWTSHADPEAVSAMNDAVSAMAQRQYDSALVLLDDLVRAHPLWPEAWNKRATLFFLVGRDQESANDIRRTLQLEPRHFGALAGFAQICLRHGETTAAAIACDAALRIHPHSPAMRTISERLIALLPRGRH